MSRLHRSPPFQAAFTHDVSTVFLVINMAFFLNGEHSDHARSDSLVAMLFWYVRCFRIDTSEMLSEGFWW